MCVGRWRGREGEREGYRFVEVKKINLFLFFEQTIPHRKFGFSRKFNFITKALFTFVTNLVRICIRREYVITNSM